MTESNDEVLPVLVPPKRESIGEMSQLDQYDIQYQQIPEKMRHNFYLSALCQFIASCSLVEIETKTLKINFAVKDGLCYKLFPYQHFMDDKSGRVLEKFFEDERNYKEGMSNYCD